MQKANGKWRCWLVKLVAGWTFLLGGLCLGQIPFGHGQNKLDRLRSGLKPAEVQALLGEPAYISRQILYRRHIEAWIYEQNDLHSVEFEFVRGEEPRLLNVYRVPMESGR